jgi:Leucine-rich repeat (LRR) protein
MKEEAQKYIEECRNIQGSQLDLTGCEVAYLSAIADLGRYLTVLFIGDNKISDISLLSNFINLRELYIGNNHITDLRPLSGLDKLVVLQLQSNKIGDIKPLSGLINLLELDISNNQIKDIKPLTPLSKLEYLTLENNPFDPQPVVKIEKGHQNQAILDFLRLNISDKRQVVMEVAQNFIEKGKLEQAIKQLTAHFKEENNRDMLLKITLLSQQLNEVKEKLQLGLIDVTYQRTEHARITQALLTFLWDLDA